MNTWRAWLTERKLHELLPLPESVLEREWQPTEADRNAAWDLYTELRTRVTTQPLHYRAGDEEAALESLFKLFGLTRELLHKYQRKGSHFAILSVFMLNGVLRPFTARWHKLKLAGRLNNEDVRHDFRQALIVLQEKLVPFQSLLGHLAEDQSFAEKSETPDAVAAKVANILGGDLVPRELLGDVVAGLWACENADIVQRRAVVLGQKDATPANLVGLAISGGGIRSATFALGVTQRLAEQGFLAEVDYLSTVSGGGYLGSFISSYLDSKEVGVGPKAEELPYKLVENNEAPPIRHLRNHSKYLIEGTWFNHLHTIGQGAYGVLTNLLILLPFVVLLTTVTAYFEGDAIQNAMKNELKLELHWFTQGMLVLLAGVVFGLGLVQNLARNGALWKLIRDKFEAFAVYVVLVTAGALAFDVAPAVFRGYDQFLNKLPTWLNMGLGLLTPTTLGALVVAARRHPTWSIWLMRLFWFSGPLALVFFYFSLTHLLITEMTPGIDWWRTPIPFGEYGGVPWWILVAAAVGIIIYCFSILNINMTSPHCFYRKQLSSVYLLQPGPGNEPKGNDELKLSDLGSSTKAPYHLVNGALSLSTSTRADLRGRESDFFLFSKYYCGSPILGYFPTKDWEALDGHLNLGTAMAISGAAAAPIMGMASIFGASFMLTILNVRLGYWLRNPNRRSNLAIVPTALSGPGPGYLLSEMLGRSDENTRYVNVTDGGHLENLGIYELLRRRCKFLIAIDAECDPEMTFFSLMQVIRFARIDFGVHIDIDLTELRLDTAGFSKAHYALGVIDYGNGERGFLLYLKASLTGNEPEYVLAYKANHPAFPHQSTAQQLYSEEQFEAYRALGHHVASALFRPELVGAKFGRSSRMKDWFQSLVGSLIHGS